MPSVFISYRREDSSGHTGRIHDDLNERLGPDHVFIDIATIEPGVDFVEAIQAGIGKCKVLLVVIGRSWLTLTDGAGRRRLDDPRDYVRVEVVTALQRGVRVIPVLVGGASMPAEADLPEPLRELARRNAFELSDHRWKFDIEQLAGMVRRLIGLPEPHPRPRDPPRSRLRPYLVGGAGGVVALLALLVWAGLQQDAPVVEPLPAVGRESVVDGIPGSPGTATPATEAAAPDPVAEHRAAILETLGRAGEAEIRASKALDPTLLRGVYTGTALQALERDIANMQVNGFHVAAILHGRDIGSLQVSPDGRGARVSMTEHWSAEIHSNFGDACIGRLEPYASPQRVSLVRTGSGWMIDALLESNTVIPDPVPCY